MHDDVKDYYGNVLQQSEDLKTNACCTAASIPNHLKAALSNIHDDVLSKYYGCGLIAPNVLADMYILDLGCGSGRDCYVLSQWVGENGRIVKRDIENYTPAAAGTSSAPVAKFVASGQEDFDEVANSNMRKAIAKNHSDTSPILKKRQSSTSAV